MITYVVFENVSRRQNLSFLKGLVPVWLASSYRDCRATHKVYVVEFGSEGDAVDGISEVDEYITKIERVSPGDLMDVESYLDRHGLGLINLELAASVPQAHVDAAVENKTDPDEDEDDVWIQTEELNDG